MARHKGIVVQDDPSVRSLSSSPWWRAAASRTQGPAAGVSASIRCRRPLSHASTNIDSAVYRIESDQPKRQHLGQED
jgi:hypothetical protein